ncbi:hypothetical protein F4V43_04765 [Paenibacillus spiritus]|uniref:Uncharacterized protein n=1 Tax=Paenibacillus spiritus TaxID=2496557 RepID=A0A5J5GE03_9BACL|nr:MULTISPECIES: hypothetical protein [Paenibacillus]KAA9006277.1 hypothetical protein F4V43_04765 [Paenibacillus spiritus]
MKLRIVPILLTSLLSVAVLFGGWFLYRHYAVQEPLQRIVDRYEGVKSSHITINRHEVLLKLDLQPGTKLRDLVQYINSEGKSEIGSRTLKLDVEQHSGKQLDEYWDKAMFSVAEAMESRKYTLIPQTLEELSGQYKGITVETDIDDRNVYVSLWNGTESKFVILPRESDTMGVWTNA